MPKKSIKTLIISDSHRSDVRGIWCFNYLAKNIKLGYIGPKHHIAGLKIIGLFMNYLRKYALTYFFSPKWDVVISNSFLEGFGLSIFQLFGLRRGTKHIIIDQAVSSANPILYPFFRLVVSRASKIICFTTKQADWWNNQLGFNKAIFVPYAIIGKKNSISTIEKDYIFSGGGSSRDYATLVRAANNVAASFIIVALKDPVTRKTSLEGITLPSNVTVLQSRPHDQFFKLIQESKIMIIPLKDIPHVGGQKVLLETFSTGKPVITTRTAGMEDYVEDGKTGILVSPNNPDELKIAINSLLKDDHLRKLIGSNARKAFETTYNPVEIGKRVSEIIEEVSS